MGRRFDVSVVIPAYNSSIFISAAIESVLNQTYPVSEIIIIDDGSTDNTKELVLSIESNLIKYFKIENGGTHAARKYSLEKVSSEWIAFLDSDDEWLENHIEQAFQTISSNLSCGLYFSNFTEIGSNASYCNKFQSAPIGWWDGTFYTEKGDVMSYQNEGFFMKLMEFTPIFPSCTLVKKLVCESIQPFSMNVIDTRVQAEDFYFTLKMSLMTKVVSCSAITVKISKHGANQSVNTTKDFEGHIYILKELVKDLSLKIDADSILYSRRAYLLNSYFADKAYEKFIEMLPFVKIDNLNRFIKVAIVKVIFFFSSLKPNE